MTEGGAVTRAEMQREWDRTEQRIMQSNQDRWAEHGRQHVGDQKVLAELRSDFKVATSGFEAVLDEIKLWRAEIKGQLTILKWFLGVVTVIIASLLVTLMTKAFW